MPMFRHLLVLPDGETNDPVVFVSPIRKWSVGETFLLSEGERLRILGIETEIDDLLVRRRFAAVFTVERVDD